MEPTSPNGNYPYPEPAPENLASPANTSPSLNYSEAANSPDLPSTSSPSYYTQPPGYFQPAPSYQNPAAKPAVSKSRGGLFLALILLAVVLLVSGTAILVWVYQDNQLQQQIAIQKTAQVTAVAQAVGTANGKVTAIVQMQQQAAGTAEANMTATAIAPATATAHVWQPTVQPLDQQGKQVYSGSGILNQSEPNQFAIHSSNTGLQNFIASVSFQNPSDPTDHNWDYGFLFRRTGTDREFRLYIMYDGYWALKLGEGKNSDGSASTSTIIDGYISNWNSDASKSNELKIYVKSDKGLFFVNNQLVASLDLVSKLDAGDVEIGTGFQFIDAKTQKVIRYQDFSVYSLDSAS